MVLLNKRQIHTYDVTDNISIQLVEIPILRYFPTCTYCGEGNFWNKTWPAALALSRYLAQGFPLERLKGSRALVIGSGVGLEGFVLAKLGAAVSFLDHISDALQVVSQNCLLNEIGHFQTICCCWKDPNIVGNIGKYDLVIGSDVLYNPKEWMWIESLLKISLKANGLALFSDPMRSNVMDFFRGLDKASFRVKYSKSHFVNKADLGLAKASFRVKWGDPRWSFENRRILIYCFERL